VKKFVKIKDLGRLKASLIFLICLIVIMITPAAAVQLSTSNINSLSDSKIKSCESIKNSKNMRNNMLNVLDSSFKLKTNTNNKILMADNYNNGYAKQAAIAGKILPIMEESYQNNSKGIKATHDSFKKLESKEVDTTKKIEKTRSKLDNFEVNSNNIDDYKKLKKEYKDYNSLKKTIKITKSEVNRMKVILNKKQTHTKNCINALKHIKMSEQVKNSVIKYNKNMKSLTVISDNMATEIQQKKEILKLSNNTYNTNINDVSNSTTNSTDTESNKVTSALKYTGIGIGSLTGAACVTTIASLVAYGVTSYSAFTALKAASAAAVAYESLVTNIFSSSQIYAAQPAFLKSVLATRLAETAVATSELAGMVSTIIVVVAVVLVIATTAIMIAYCGYKFNWW